MDATLRAPDRPFAGVLTVAFGATVAMWGVGYAGRLPAVLLPSPALLVLLLACPFAGGLILGRYAARGWWPGIATGAAIGTLNLLVLGSFLGGDAPNTVVPSALWWVPGSMLVAALLAGSGASIGARWLPAAAETADWSGPFARVAVVATMLLLAVGGLVTSAEAGLAVVDWPNSFGYNMFLYPFSRMTGPIYYEHAHRLFGALVGLTTLVLAVFLQRVEPRRWVRRLGWLALVMVVFQGLLGGLRVTGHLTLSQSPDVTSPNLALAMVHGILAQIFLGTLVAIGAFTSPTWRGAAAPLRRPGSGADRRLAGLMVLLVITQLLLGASQRHFKSLLFVHIVFGVAMVVPIAMHVGFRAWGLNSGQPLLQRLGLGLVWTVGAQVLLGIGTFVATGAAGAAAESRGAALVLATAHQWVGAILLALCVLLLCWSYRLLGDPPSVENAAS